MEIYTLQLKALKRVQVRMFNPFLVFSPAAALVGAQGHHQANAHLNSADIMSLLEGAEWDIILYILLMAFGLAFTIISGILIYIVPSLSVFAMRAWYCIGAVSFLTFIVTFVILIEPRPLHWRPMIESVWKAARRYRPTEIRERIRAWWRWRNKYSLQQRTKLNV